jgi:hypothetical protein
VVIRYLYKQHAKELKEKDEAHKKALKEKEEEHRREIKKRGANNGGYQRSSK